MSYAAAPASNLSPAARLVAAGEVALKVSRDDVAATLAERALTLDPHCARAYRLIALIEDPPVPRAVDGRRSRAGIPGRVRDEFVRALGGRLTDQEARTVLEGIIRHGRCCTRVPRRLGGGALGPGVTLRTHHRRPDVGVLLDDGRVLGVLHRGRRVP